MPRKPTPNTAEFPIHLTARSNNQDWFKLPLPKLWEICVANLEKAHHDFGFLTHAFVLMSNHYHWLVSTPQANLGPGMCRFQTEVSQTTAKLTGRKNHIFGGRYKPSVIRNGIYYANVYRYIYQNPLRAGIVDRVEKYSWSTLSSSDFRVQPLIDFEHALPKENLLEWLNTPPCSVSNKYIRSGLRRFEFGFPLCRHSKKPIAGGEFL